MMPIFSYSVANREPNRRDYTESSPQSRPRPETLHNFELGYAYNTGRIMLSANSYLMYYRDQLVLTGQVNDVGAYIRQNIDRSYRAGIELQAAASLTKRIAWNGNVTFSQNKVLNFKEFLDNYDDGTQQIISYDNTDIAFSPSVIAASQLTYKAGGGFEVGLLSKYVGKQYLDNTQNESRKLDSFFTNDLRLHWATHAPKVLPFVNTFGVSLLANNLFDTLYESNGYTFGYISGGQTFRENYFYPQAGRNFLLQVLLRF